MTLGAVSTQYLANSLSLSVTQAQAELTTLQTEATTGQYADLGLQLGEESGYELLLKNQNNLLQTLTSANGVVSMNLSATQSSLDSIRSGAQTALQDLTEWSSASGTDATLQDLGTSSLQSFTQAMNATSNGQYVFGGVNSGVAPIADYFSSPTSAAKTAVANAFSSYLTSVGATASTVSASQMQTFLASAPFTSIFGSNWTTDWSSASSVNTSSEIAPGQTAETSTNANQHGFQQLAQAYAMLTEFGAAPLSASAQQAVASTASSLISSALTSLTNTEAVVGAAQSQITDANSAMSSQMTLLQQQVDSLDNVNSYSVATQLSTLQTQLETAYQLTAQISQLSLAKFLPVA